MSKHMIQKSMYCKYFYTTALCPDPADVMNGTVTFNGNSVGDTATYTCTLQKHEGYFNPASCNLRVNNNHMRVGFAP